MLPNMFSKTRWFFQLALHVPDATIANLENVGQPFKLHAHILDILDHISNEFVD
jgi:hypothetical protein